MLKSKKCQGQNWFQAKCTSIKEKHDLQLTYDILNAPTSGKFIAFFYIILKESRIREFTDRIRRSVINY